MLELKGHTAGVEHLDGNRAKITIIIDPETFEKGLNHAYETNKKKINIPGFRKGKVPRKLVEAQYGKDFFYEDAINEVLPDAYDNAVEEYDLLVVSRPEVDVAEAEAGSGVVVTAEVQLKPKAAIQGYKGLECPAVDLDVTDDEVENAITSERNKNARYVSVGERGVLKGDFTNINFEGFVDGEPFEGGKGNDYELEIGGGMFIPGFEEQLIGMNVDDEAEVNVTFPEDYRAEHLAGKQAMFKVKLNALYIKEMPDLDDEFAQSVSDFDTFEEYKADVEVKLLKNREETGRQVKEEALARVLSEKVEVDLPDVMVDTEINHMLEGFASSLRGRGMSFEQYLQYSGESMEDIRDSYKEVAERNVRTRLALEAVAEAEGFTASEEEIDEEVKKIAERYRMEAEKLRDSMAPRERRALGRDIAVQKAMELVVDSSIEKKEE